MNDIEFEALRWEMIDAFYIYSSIKSGDLHSRMAAWDKYCESREVFLEQRCYRQGAKYVNLRQQIVEIQKEK